MSKVRWLAPKESYRRALSAADFKTLGVDHAQDETFCKENDFTVQMGDSAGETLASKLPEEFVVLNSSGVGSEDSPVVQGQLPLDPTADQTAGVDPDDLSSESSGDEQDEKQVTPHKKNRRPQGSPGEATG